MSKSKSIPWTKFMDMHSGGSRKEPYMYIYIEAPEKEAKVIFYNRFNHNPDRITCSCCGEDYSVIEFKDLTQATAFERSDACGRKYTSLKDYLNRFDILVIRDEDINLEERTGEIPKQGYVWMD